jgi:hypothetical protein
LFAETLPTTARSHSGWSRTAELLVSKNVNDIFYRNLNYLPTGTLPDGRLTYSKKDQNLNDVILLANTPRGSSWTTTLKAERPFANGFYASGSYLYNRAKSVNDGTTSVARSNWAFGSYVNYDVNNPPLTTSDYETAHRVTLTATIPIPISSAVRSAASLYYNGQSGQPYSIVFNGDANGDGVTTNDIAFVPASPDQVSWPMERGSSSTPTSRAIAACARIAERFRFATPATRRGSTASISATASRYLPAARRRSS